jgi:hypothetical protein
VPELYRIVDKKVHQFAQASRRWYSWPKQSSGNFGGDHLAILLYAIFSILNANLRVSNDTGAKEANIWHNKRLGRHWSHWKEAQEQNTLEVMLVTFVIKTYDFALLLINFDLRFFLAFEELDNLC